MERRGSSRRPYSGIFKSRFQSRRDAADRAGFYLALPSNLLGESISVENPFAERSRVVPRIGADPESLAEAAKLLAQAKRPVIVAGSGVAKAGAIDELIKFAEMIAAPVVMEPRYLVSELSDRSRAELSSRRAPAVVQSTGLGRAGFVARHRLAG